MSESQLAYEEIIRPIEDRMIRSIWRIVRSPPDAEDAMQDALMRIWKRWGHVCRHPNPQALVLKICVDAAYDVTRRRLAEPAGRPLEYQESEPAESRPTPADMLDAKEFYSEFISAIHRLPRQQAVATLMRVVQEQSYDRIASVLGCSEPTARKHVARARDKLRLLLSHRNPTHSEERTT